MHIQCENFFFPQPGLSKDFRDKFTDALKQTFAAGELHFHGQLKAPAQPGLFQSLLRQLFRHHCAVYCKPPFGGPDQVFRYLGANPVASPSRTTA